jgi:hypothetical protein
LSDNKCRTVFARFMPVEIQNPSVALRQRVLSSSLGGPLFSCSYIEAFEWSPLRRMVLGNSAVVVDCTWRPGDVANGYVMTDEGQWLP